MSFKKIVVKCSDQRGRSFEVEEPVAMLSGLLKNFLEEDMSEVMREVTVPDTIKSDIMYMVIDYCKNRANARNETELREGDKLFASIYESPYYCDPKTLIEIMKAADYLDISSLIDISCQTVANLLQRQTPLHIRREFHITGDNTPEVEAEAQAWNY